jgi:hypothetical protein
MNITGELPPTKHEVILEGKNVKIIGTWLANQRILKVNPVNSERYRLLKEHRMLEPIVRGQGEAKNYMKLI